MTSYLPYLPGQQMLLPPDLQDWLPDGHLAYYISDTIDSLDLSAFHVRYATGGPRNQPFHPTMMVKVLVYGYATGVFSSRKIAAKLHEDVAFRVLGAGNFPKHRTICDFRALHLQELSELFVQVVKLARECGLVKLGTISVDGTKIKANASRHKAMSYERMQKAEAELKAQIDALLARAERIDEAEANEPDCDLPAEIARRESRLASIAAAKARLEQRQRDADSARGRSPDDERRGRDGKGNPARGRRFKREFGTPAPEAQDNFTDPDSRIMKRSGGGYDYSYNAHAAVDDRTHIIVAAELSNNASDADRLVPMVEQSCDNTGDLPRQVIADTGFRSEEVFEQFAHGPIELIVAVGREGKGARQIDPLTHPRTAAMARKLKTKRADAAYRRRKWLSEPPNGWIKNVLGFRQFSLRGLAKVKAEWRLVCTALNLRRMARFVVA
jgi:transposase